MKTVTTVTERKATIRPMFVSRVVKPPLAVGHRQYLHGDWLRHRAGRAPHGAAARLHHSATIAIA
jgi:hypothetical protein